MTSPEFANLDTRVKLAIYRHFANTGNQPQPETVAANVGADLPAVLQSYKRLAANRLLVLEANGSSIRMASPFSGIPTQHVVISDNVQYFANCGWDALGIIAALHRSGTVYSRCEQSGTPFRLSVTAEGPESSSWIFHCHVPAANWWEDIVFT